MKTNKLWIFSIIFGLLATACFYFFMNKKGEVKPALAAGTAIVNEKTASLVSKDPTETVTISKGKRAVSIEVKAPEGVSGYIKAGSYVDVVANLTPPKSAPPNQEYDARILLQNVKVLAVGARADDAASRKKYNLVTLEVSPNQGVALSFATKYDLYLMLRNDTDHDEGSSTATIQETDLHKGVFSN